MKSTFKGAKSLVSQKTLHISSEDQYLLRVPGKKVQANVKMQDPRTGFQSHTHILQKQLF